MTRFAGERLGDIRFTKSDEEPTSFTSAGSSADSPALPLGPSPATGHEAKSLT